MRTKKEVAEKLEEIKKVAKMEHDNIEKESAIWQETNVLFMIIGWLEALNFVLKNPIDADMDFAKEKQKILENERPIDFSKFW